jgi:hypothetical protein
VSKSGPSRKPDSALSRHPSPGDSRAPRGAAPTSPWRRVRPTERFGLLAPVVCLAGPSRDTAGGLLPHPFTHHLCPGEPRPSAGLLSVALDVTVGLRPPVPRVTLARAASATSPDFALHPELEDAATGRTALTCRIIPYELREDLLAPPRRMSTILVGVRRSSTLSVLFQRFCQRGSFPTSGSNQIPGPAGSSTPS